MKVLPLAIPELIRIGIAADHGGFALKQQLVGALTVAGYLVTDFGAYRLNKGDDYPDFIVPLAMGVTEKRLFKGIAICGSGVGACIAANKIAGIRACLITESFSAHQGVEDDDMNIICLGGLITEKEKAWALVQIFLGARFKGFTRFKRRLAKVAMLEQ